MHTHGIRAARAGRLRQREPMHWKQRHKLLLSGPLLISTATRELFLGRLAVVLATTALAPKNTIAFFCERGLLLARTTAPWMRLEEANKKKEKETSRRAPHGREGFRHDFYPPT